MKCFECGKHLTVANGYVALVNQHGGYPVDPATTQTRLECADCGGNSYSIDFERLLRDGLDGARGWLTHLRGKEWMGPRAFVEITETHDRVAALNDEEHWEPKRLTDPAPKAERAPRAARAIGDPNPRAISSRTRSLVMERDGFRCRRCGQQPPDVRLVVDHVVPVSKGGTADVANLQTLCNDCNAGKSDRDPHEHDKRGLA